MISERIQVKKQGMERPGLNIKTQTHHPQNNEYLYLLFLMETGKRVSWVSLTLGLSEVCDKPELSVWAVTSSEDSEEQVRVENKRSNLPQAELWQTLTLYHIEPPRCCHTK